jgi:DNA helicase-2/ATP-dependent DNA helicase PcrA
MKAGTETDLLSSAYTSDCSELLQHVDLWITTMHSAKGREFDAVILYGVNACDLPNKRDLESPAKLRDAHRSFYVGVTRPRKELCLIYQEHHQSPWISELIQRVNAG